MSEKVPQVLELSTIKTLQEYAIKIGNIILRQATHIDLRTERGINAIINTTRKRGKDDENLSILAMDTNTILSIMIPIINLMEIDGVTNPDIMLLKAKQIKEFGKPKQKKPQIYETIEKDKEAVIFSQSSFNRYFIDSADSRCLQKQVLEKVLPTILQTQSLSTTQLKLLILPVYKNGHPVTSSLKKYLLRIISRQLSSANRMDSVIKMNNIISRIKEVKNCHQQTLYIELLLMAGEFYKLCVKN
jgi:hypothetical protein